MIKIKCAECDNGQKNDWCVGKCIFANSDGSKVDDVKKIENAPTVSKGKLIICVETGMILPVYRIEIELKGVSFATIRNSIYAESKAYGLNWRFIKDQMVSNNTGKIKHTNELINKWRNRKVGKCVLCINNGVVYKNATTAAEKLGLTQKNVSAVACGSQKSTGNGYMFKHITNAEAMNG